MLRCGCDIIEIERIKKSMEDPRFLQRVFTAGERDYFTQKNSAPQTVAGVFAAKEALVKLVGTGFRGLSFTDIEVAHTPQGKPYYRLAPRAAARLGDYEQLDLSISHDTGRAMAVAVCL